MLVWLTIKKYFAVIPGANSSETIFVMEINNILLNRIPNIWNNQAYVQVFDCVSITFKADVKTFERMKIA